MSKRAAMRVCDATASHNTTRQVASYTCVSSCGLVHWLVWRELSSWRHDGVLNTTRQVASCPCVSSCSLLHWLVWRELSTWRSAPLEARQQRRLTITHLNRLQPLNRYQLLEGLHFLPAASITSAQRAGWHPQAGATRVFVLIVLNFVYRSITADQWTVQ